ncbi:MAG TPA: hypothetical protein DEA73_10230 [Peptococcaceae bacterium]|nr:hypothetical protein [Peptococcaceae bacterium]
MIRSLAVVLVVLLSAGCSSAGQADKETHGNGGPGGGNVTLPSTPAAGEDGDPDTPVSSEGSFPASGYPREVQDLIETMKTIEGGAWAAVGDETFIVVSRGTKPTAGYAVEIREIVSKGDSAVAFVSFKDPPEDGAVAEVITYPSAVGKIKGRFTDVEFKDVDGKMDYIPRVVGLKDNYLARGEGNIRLLDVHVDRARIRVTGIARVFEAILNYELQDAGGNALQDGWIMAASGAPDWGFFQLEIDDPPPGIVFLQLYQISADDGSRRDVVTVEIK